MSKAADKYSFSSKLWFERRRVSKESGIAAVGLQVMLNQKHKAFPLNFKWPADKIDTATGKLLPRHKGDKQVDDFNLLILKEQNKFAKIILQYRLRYSDRR